MQGIELVTDWATKEPAPQSVAQVFEATCRLGLLIGKGGLYGNVLPIAPLLTASEEQVAEALEMLDIAFAQVQENFQSSVVRQESLESSCRHQLQADAIIHKLSRDTPRVHL